MMPPTAGNPGFLKTGVSVAHWCRPELKKPYYAFSPARWPHPALAESSGPISWLDRLFEGGIRVSGQSTRALTLLLTGPPGTGKSILALEMCYRFTHCIDFMTNRPTGLFCLYVSTENSAERIKTKVESFGWENARDRFQKFGHAPENPHVSVLGADKIRDYIDTESQDLGRMVERLSQDWEKNYKKTRHYTDLGLESPDILVIDSLNVISPSSQASIFNQFLSVATKGPALVIFVMESDSTGQGHEYWGYICDIIIRLDRKYSQDYMLRTLEVVKARNQQHVWGQHQLKIYPGAQPATGSARGGMQPYEQLIRARRRTPYRNEGGIFIFPSIHYYLSTYKHEVFSEDPTRIEFPLEDLNRTLAGGPKAKGGLPAGRCTALIGTRGAHKSHIGYFHLLSRILKGEKAIVVSLRDDEGMAKKTMSRILRQQFIDNPEWEGFIGNIIPKGDREDGLPYALRLLERLEMKGLLEIIYYPPGYIAPDEFFHRIFITIQDMKSEGDKPLTVLFNSLDQLPARFPLCARESIFVPGLIQMLTAEKATCIFVAVNEPGQPEEQYGLLQMADMILSMRPRRFYKKHYDWLLTDYLLKKEKKPASPGKKAATPETAPSPKGKKPATLGSTTVNPKTDQMVQKVVLYMMRIPGGRTAGARGMLELVNEESGGLKQGLHFIPFPPEFPVGEIVEF